MTQPVSPVYSVRFFCIQGLSGTQTLTPNSSTTFVLRCCDIYSANGGVQNTTFRIMDQSTQATIWFHDYGVTTNGWAQWTGRQVFPPLHAIIVKQASGDLVDVTLSGYFLTGTYPI